MKRTGLILISILLTSFGMKSQTVRTYIESGVFDLDKPPYSIHYVDTLNVLMKEYKHTDDTACVKAMILYGKTIAWGLKNYSPYMDFYREVVDYKDIDTPKNMTRSEQWSSKSVAFQWLYLKNTACKRLMDYYLLQGRFSEALQVATLMQRYFLPAWCGNYGWEQRAEHNEYMARCFAGLRNIDSVMHYSKVALQTLAGYVGKDGFHRDDKMNSAALYPYKPTFYQFMLDFLSKNFNEETMAQSVEDAYNDIQCEWNKDTKTVQCHTTFMKQVFDLLNERLIWEGNSDETAINRDRHRETFKQGYLYQYFSKN